MSTKKDTTKSTRSAAANNKKSSGFTAEEKAAMQERARELKAEQRAAKNKEEGLKSVLAKIAEMPGSDRTLAKQIHAIVQTNAPDLMPKLWYGMPAYAQDDKIVCFFQPASKFKTRYATFGFNDTAKLDEGGLFPVAFAVKELNAADQAKLSAIVKKAVS